jgi:hypothetical protein
LDRTGKKRKRKGRGKKEERKRKYKSNYEIRQPKYDSQFPVVFVQRVNCKFQMPPSDEENVDEEANDSGKGTVTTTTSTSTTTSTRTSRHSRFRRLGLSGIEKW